METNFESDNIGKFVKKHFEGEKKSCKKRLSTVFEEQKKDNTHKRKVQEYCIEDPSNIKIEESFLKKNQPRPLTFMGSSIRYLNNVCESALKESLLCSIDDDLFEELSTQQYNTMTILKLAKNVYRLYSKNKKKSKN